jgi:hypothetical protein
MERSCSYGEEMRKSISFKRRNRENQGFLGGKIAFFVRYMSKKYIS